MWRWHAVRFGDGFRAALSGVCLALFLSGGFRNRVPVDRIVNRLRIASVSGRFSCAACHGGFRDAAVARAFGAPSDYFKDYYLLTDCGHLRSVASFEPPPFPLRWRMLWF